MTFHSNMLSSSGKVTLKPSSGSVESFFSSWDSARIDDDGDVDAIAKGSENGRQEEIQTGTWASINRTNVPETNESPKGVAIE